MPSSSRQHGESSSVAAVTLPLGQFADRLRSAAGPKDRRSLWADYLHRLVVGAATRGDHARDVCADALGVGRSRVTAMLVGDAAFGIADVAALTPEQARGVLELLAELLGYRVLPVLRAVQGAGELAQHVQAIASAAAVIAGASTAAADGIYDRVEATPLRARVRELRAALDGLDGLLAEAEARGARGVA